MQRAKIILELASGKTKGGVAREQKINKKTIAKWYKRWCHNNDKLIEIEKNPDITLKELFRNVIEVLSDKPRSGTPPTFTPEQIVQIIAIACEVILKCFPKILTNSLMA